MPLLISVLSRRGLMLWTSFSWCKLKVPPESTLFFPFDLRLSFEKCKMHGYFHQRFDKKNCPTHLSSRWSVYHFIHIDVYIRRCVLIYNFLRIMIYPIALEWIVRSRLAELSKNLMISLSMRNRIILSKLEAVVCVSYGLAICLVSLRASSQWALGNKAA